MATTMYNHVEPSTANVYARRNPNVSTERLYYPLKKAAELLKCDEDYLIHLASEGYIELCVKLGRMVRGINGVNGDYELNEQALAEKARGIISDAPSRKKFKIHYDDLPNTMAAFEVVCDVSIDTGSITDYSMTLSSAKGIFSLSKDDVYAHELDFISGRSVYCHRFGFPKAAVDVDDIFSNVEPTINGLIGSIELKNDLEVDKDRVVITYKEINRIKSIGFPSMKTLNLDIEPSEALTQSMSPNTLAKVVTLNRALVSLIPGLKNL